jgi:TRAP-type C4-dicarboxylate transport system substrate-binding protein
VFNSKAYNALPGQYQQLLEDLKPGAYAAIGAAYKEKDVANEKKWKEGGKIQMVKIPESEMAQFRKVAGKPVWDQWVKDNQGKIPAKELLDLVLKTAGAM